jgi:pimeloyl-ACP methyl ester carboxylesterase
MDANFWLMSRNKSLYCKTFEEKFYNPAKIPDWLVDESWEMLKNHDYRRAFHRNAQYLSRIDPRFRDDLKLIRARTLIIWGEQDQVVSVSDAQKFAELIPGAEVKILEACGHLVLLECGEQCSDIILSFLGEEDMYYSSDEM